MTIRVGKYTLRSDAFCMWIEEEYETKKGKLATRKVAGYSTSLRSLLESFREKKMLDSDAETIEELIEALRAIMDDIARIDREAMEQHFKILERTINND